MNWKEKLGELTGCAYNTCPEHGTQVQLKFIKTEIIEKLIADIPKVAREIEDKEGWVPDDLLKLQLKNKWL
jgi:hypothetical protein